MQDVSPGDCLVLDGNLTVRNAAAICATLLDSIKVRDLVSVECSAAAEIDLSFVQLLVAARQSATLAGKTVKLAARPAGLLLEVLSRGGFRVTPDDSADAGSFWFDGAST